MTTGAPPAADLPVARVVVDVPLAHLDRPFDYLVPEKHAAAAVPGARVRVRFAGRLVDAWVLERVATSEHGGRLAPLAGAPSAEPVLAPEIARLAREAADRYAGTLADVLRLAVPPRHAGAEAAPWPTPDAPPVWSGEAREWSAYTTGVRYLDALREGRPARAVWAALPGPDGWPRAVATAVAATVAGGRGAVVVVPDARDVARVDAALTDALGPGHHTCLTADLGPRERYRRFLAVRRGAVRAVVGTRAAAFAPVRDLGLAVVWDDGDDLHAEPRAPYCHVREVLVLRAHLAGAAALIGGHVVTAEGAALLASGWAKPLVAPRGAVRAAAPRVVALGDDAQLARDPAAHAARLPSVAWQAARRSLAAGAPVLVQVPRRGYVPALACAGCRATARCPTCAGPLGQASASGAPPACRWCGQPAVGWECPACGGHRLRAVVVGSRRTAEELGRAFPGATVRTSGAGSVLASVPAAPALVVATPGAEPVADGGYGAVLLLDPWLLLGRADLRAAEEALRRWALAAALARPAPDGQVVVVADAGVPAVQALIRWDPLGFAERELADRSALGLPPASRIAALAGPPAVLAEAVSAAELPASAEVLGPVPAAAGERMLVRVQRRDGPALARALQAMSAVRSARKAEPVQVRLDPRELL